MRRKAMLALALCCMGLLAVPSLAGQAASQEVKYEDATPSHVYQVTSDLISEIEILREAMGVTVYPVEAELQEDRAPVHVYSKTLEVLEKISAAQRRLGIDPVNVGQIPVKDITPGMFTGVCRQVSRRFGESRSSSLLRIKFDPLRSKEARRRHTSTSTSAMLRFCWTAWSDIRWTRTMSITILCSFTTKWNLSAAKLKVALELDPPVIDQRKRMKEVAQQVLRATFKIINLQTRLGMDASGVPQITLVRVSPAEVCEATNILLAEMVRIKAHLDIPLPRQEHALSRNKRPRDVFSQVLLLIRNLDLLAKAADNYQSV